MIRIGIVGGTGFTGGELLRILAGHPESEVLWVYSRTEAGKKIHEIHPDLEGEYDLNFVDEAQWDLDLVFLCLPHGTAKKFVEESNIPDDINIIDLSSDYRLYNDQGFVYGLPELNREAIKQTRYVANPGCFATAIQLGLLPLAGSDLLADDIHVTAITGSTGAGKKLSATTHFTWMLPKR